jgi:integrase
MGLADARAKVIRMQRSLQDGIDPRTAESRRRPVTTLQTLSSATAPAIENKHSIENVAREFMEREVKPNRLRPQYVQDIINRDILSEWKGRDARSITAREVTELLDKIVDRGSRTMANRVAATLHQMFDSALDRGVIDASPVRSGLRPGGKESPRERALSDAEVAAFLRDPLACTRQPRLSYTITVLLATAARRSELALAKWSHIDLEAKTWRVPGENSKSGKPFIIPLSTMAVEAFQRLQKRANGSVWVLPGSDAKEHIDAKLLTRGVAKCLKRFEAQGIKAFVLHDLRRTARTGLGKLGIATHVAERCLNHSIGGMVAVYDVGDYLTERRAALDAWSAHLEALRDSKPEKVAKAA